MNTVIEREDGMFSVFSGSQRVGHIARSDHGRWVFCSTGEGTVIGRSDDISALIGAIVTGQFSSYMRIDDVSG